MKKSIIYIAALIIGIQTVNAQVEIVSKQPDKVYIGGIIKASSLNKDKYEFVDIPTKPITIIFSSPNLGKSMEIEPSYENMMKALRERMEGAGEITQLSSFKGSIQEIESYKQLDFLFGQNINKLTYFGIPENQKPKKTMAVMHMQSVYYYLGMDYHEIDAKAIEGYSEKELVYPISVGFGRKVIVLVESDYDYSDLKPAIEYMNNKAKGDKNKDDKMEAIIANSIIRIMCLGKNLENADPSNPLAEAMEYMNAKVNAEDFGIPIVFSLSDVKTNGVYKNEF